MNKNEKFFLLQKLASLQTYSDLLPDEFQKTYLSDLESVKKFISDYKVEEKSKAPISNPPQPHVAQPIPENEASFLSGVSNTSAFTSTEEENQEDFNYSDKPSLAPLRAKPMLEPLEDATKQKPQPIKSPPPPNPVMGGMQGFVSYVKPQQAQPDILPDKPILSSVKANVDKRSSFEFSNSALVPKFTAEGKKALGDLSLPINFYLLMKLIDDKTSIFKLFEKYHKLHSTNYLEFSGTLYELEQNKYINFIKVLEAPSKDSYMIRLDEFFSEGKMISAQNLEKAQDIMKATGAVFLPKTLISMRLLTEDTIGNCIKIQKWVARMYEKAQLVKEEVELKQKPEQTLSQTKAPSINFSGNIPLPSGVLPPPPGFAPPPPPSIPKEDKDDWGVLDFIIPIFNDKGNEILSSEEHKELAKRLSIIDGKSSLFKNYVKNKQTFKDNKLSFLKFVVKLASQDIFSYKSNSEIKDIPVWARFGDMLVSMGLSTQDQLGQALEHKEESNIYIGQAFVELGIIEESILQDVLKIQAWLNKALSNLCYETSFVEVIQSVLMDSFKCKVDIGVLKKVSFKDPLKNIVYIKYPISGKLNGKVYYISDRNFMQNLAKTLMASVGAESTDEFDESYVGTVSSVIISNSLSKLSQKGLFPVSEMARILMEKEVKMEKEILVADGNQFAMIPLINQWGRFAIGLEVS